ncbi:MAG: AMP-binding protein, partial [bacterium]|nr:AMP-binding protein [bacterium]
CPVNVTGELYIGDDGVARGYLNSPELTIKSFVGSRGGFSKEPLAAGGIGGVVPLYKTGDLARWLPDGNIEFLGRIDHQVKVRGFRIELGEIENRLLAYVDVKEAVVLARENERAENYLCAYVVAGRPVGEELKEFLGETLPEYMVPSYFMEIAEMPLNPNGKIDREALPLPGAGAEAALTAPRNDVEEKLLEIWCDVLNLERGDSMSAPIGIDSDFFEAGGHSLSAALLVSRMDKAFNRQLALVEVFTSPTIRRLAQSIIETELPTAAVTDQNPVLLRRREDSRRHFFLVHDGTGEVDGYLEFSRRLANDFNCWGIRADRIEGYGPRNITVEEIAAGYIERIRGIQPEGPYYLAGWSIGGTIVFEIARQMEQLNLDIRFLALIDAPGPRAEWVEETQPFTLESELDWIRRYLPGRDFGESVEQLWQSVVNYLEKGDFDVETVKRVITQNEALVLPAFHRERMDRLIRRMNSGRSLVNARSAYIPSGKVNSAVHFFKAGDSPVDPGSWSSYCGKGPELHEVSGDHFSIFRLPDVDDFAAAFSRMMV